MKKTTLKKQPMNQGASSYFKTHKKLLAFSAIGFILLCLVTLGPIFVKAMMEENAARTLAIQEKNMAIESAIVNNDYQAWSSLVTDENLKSKINSSNFSQFTQIYRLLQQGKLEEADIIKKQLNLKQDFMVVSTKSSLIDAAINNNDYSAWRSIVGASWEPAVNATNFSSYAEAYKLLVRGKLKQADILKQRINLSQKYDYTSSR